MAPDPRIRAGSIRTAYLLLPWRIDSLIFLLAATEPLAVFGDQHAKECIR